MIQIAPLIDSTSLLGDPLAIRARWKRDSVLFFRGLMDRELIDWARGQYRGALAAEGLIDPSEETPAWTGTPPRTRRPCDALGTRVWHEIVKQPALNAVMRDIFDGEPVWIPIVAHRSGMPTGQVAEGEDIFVGRHQDGVSNEGIEFAVCWMPIRDVTLNSGGFAVAPGTHDRGVLHSREHGGRIPADAIAPEAWRSENYRVGDVLIFNYLTAHATLPNPSNEIRMSLDVRAVPASAPQPLVGIVERVDGLAVTIEAERGGTVTVHVSDRTLIRDMNPTPPVPIGELERIAYPGAHVIAMTDADRNATVLRRNFY